MGKTRIGFIALVTVIFANILIFAIRPLGDSFFLLADMLVVSLSFAAFLFGIRAYMLHGFKSMQGKALLMLSLGSFFWFIGESIWSFFDISGMGSPVASYADIAWFIGYPLFAAGLYFVWRTAGTPKTRSRMYASIISISLIIASAALFLAAPLLMDTETGVIEKIVTSGYYIGDVVLASGCIMVVISLAGGRLFKPWVIITIAIVLSAAGDIAYSYMSGSYESGNWIDILWNLNYILMAYGFFYYSNTIKALIKDTGGKR
jgi:hypothetical protein